jgi:cytochrome c oxidase subunit 2
VRRTLVAVILVGVTVLLAASWFGWGKEGAKPVAPATTGADDINELYAFIGFFAVAIFLSVMIPLALIIARYRERGLPREVEGPQIRGNTRLELMWTAIPIGIVIVISAFTLYKASAIIDPASAAGEDELEIAVEGRQFYWRYVYPDGQVAIDTLRVPVDRVVDLEITAPDDDVAHSFWAPAIGGKMDAIPGITNHFKFKPTRTGRFEGRCAELCGIQHADMKLFVEVLTPDEYDRWLEQTGSQQQAGGPELGQTLFEGVCTKCHFAAPEYAPNIATNPILGDAGAIRELVTEGRGRMPAVGRGWSERELDSLTRYLETIAPKGSSSGG